MYAIIATGGKQYKVSEGDIITIEKLGVEAGEKVNFSTGGVTGGRNYGSVRYEWTASAGSISGSGSMLGVPPPRKIVGRRSARVLSMSSRSAFCSLASSAAFSTAAFSPEMVSTRRLITPRHAAEGA